MDTVLVQCEIGLPQFRLHRDVSERYRMPRVRLWACKKWQLRHVGVSIGVSESVSASQNLNADVVS